MTPVDDRHLITERLDDTLVVEAAAGTGKTTELVARIVALIKSGRARVTEIVAVTFSEKAAGELKLRLREELERARTEVSPASRERTLLDAAVLEFEEAHVSTIHGFCAELLRERPVEAAIDPSFQVMTETQSEALFDEAFAGWMEKALEQPGEGVRRSLRRPTQISRWRDDEEEEGPIARLRKAARDLLQWRDHPTPWKRPEWDRTATIDTVVQAVVDVAELTKGPIYESDILWKDTASLRRAAREIERAARTSPRDYDGLEALLTSLASDRSLAETRKGHGAMYSRTVARQTVLEQREALLSVLRNFKAVADADLAALLHSELQDCLRRYEERKRRTGALDFLDLLIRARDLVRDCAPVRVSFQQRFKYILVDEFQDTDPLQAELLQMLAEDATGRHRPGALFIVGDPKQSIYRFRRADVGVYQQVCDELLRAGGRAVQLKRSFRSVPNIQRFVNAAFSVEMKQDADSLQAGYVELLEDRPEIPGQPSVIALPVPRPYGFRRISKRSIDECLPDTIAEFVRWLVQSSNWRVTNGSEAPRPVRESDVCLLFRRFIAYQDDVTRKYVEALEARGIAHLLVGGKTFHDREEVDALRTALAAIEWPEDELSVFATLRGPLFAFGDEELLEYHALAKQVFRGHAFHPYHVPDNLPAHLAPIGEALGVLRELHAGRNYRPVADTIGRLIEATRAHAGFMLWRGGEQVLANVLHISELARQYELEGGLSFRGFVETLRSAAERAQAPEAPILEEGSEGVRLMTVHKAKGLEFPVVILADISCGLSREDAQRYLDSSRDLCAVRLAGWAPLELLEHNDREARRDRAEGVRLAYVAATRARDVLVVPAIGDGPFNDGWVSPLNNALYPPIEDRRSPMKAIGCPEFVGKDTVLERPDGEQAASFTMKPGQYQLTDPISKKPVTVVWWDPLLLDVKADNSRGLRRDDLISKDADPEDVAADRARYEEWRARKLAVIESAARPSLQIVTATEWAHGIAGAAAATAPGSATGAAAPTTTAAAARPIAAGAAAAPARAAGEDAAATRKRASPPEKGTLPVSETKKGTAPTSEKGTVPMSEDADRFPLLAAAESASESQISKMGTVPISNGPGKGTVPISEIAAAVQILDGSVPEPRPSGKRFGVLVHALLAAVPFTATDAEVAQLAALHARVLGATDEERDAAVRIVGRVLRHDLITAARRAATVRREAPVSIVLDGTLIDGQVDLAFETGDGWTVVDFKTDAELGTAEGVYRQQIALYAHAIAQITNRPARGVLLRV